MKQKFSAASALCLMFFSSTEASAYADAWTEYFDPNAYTIAFDDSGIRYIAGLPSGVTSGCTLNAATIWISGANKKGATAAVLTAVASGKLVRFYLHQENGDEYCRSSIVEMKAG